MRVAFVKQWETAVCSTWALGRNVAAVAGIGVDVVELGGSCAVGANGRILGRPILGVVGGGRGGPRLGRESHVLVILVAKLLSWLGTRRSCRRRRCGQVLVFKVS